MSAKIRKLTLSYPFKIDDRQQKTVFSVDDTKVGNGLKVIAIQEMFDKYTSQLGYRISVEKDGHVKQWKDIFPEGCTKEVEYFVG